MLSKRGRTHRRRNKRKARKSRKIKRTVRRQKAGSYEIYTMDNYKGLPISSTGVYTFPTGTQTYEAYMEDRQRAGDSNDD
jgi:hypothetical protein